MKDIVIIGAGGFGREVQWLIERINEENQTWNIIGYVDDALSVDDIVDDYHIIGNVELLENYNKPISVVCAIGNAKVRKKVVEKLKNNSSIEFPNLVDPSVLMSKRVQMGKGNIICAGTILTVDIKIEDFNIINLDCTIGHDVEIEKYITVYPSVNISGCVTIESISEIGTGSQIIQGIKITSNVIIGAGSVVVKDITNEGTYVGVPVRGIS